MNAEGAEDLLDVLTSRRYVILRTLLHRENSPITLTESRGMFPDIQRGTIQNDFCPLERAGLLTPDLMKEQHVYGKQVKYTVEEVMLRELFHVLLEEMNH